MKITNLTLSMGATNNMGDYESVRTDVGLTVQLEEGEDPTRAYREAAEELDDLFGRELQRQLDLFQRIRR